MGTQFHIQGNFGEKSVVYLNQLGVPKFAVNHDHSHAKMTTVIRFWSMMSDRNGLNRTVIAAFVVLRHDFCRLRSPFFMLKITIY